MNSLGDRAAAGNRPPDSIRRSECRAQQLGFSDCVVPWRAQRILFVGAERPNEFGEALGLARAGHKVVAVNPYESSAARRFARMGGSFMRTGKSPNNCNATLEPMTSRDISTAVERRLRLAFQSVPKSHAQKLLGRLLLDTSDSLTKLFRYKRHPATQG